MVTADAVVVGGGIAGASALFHLCALGLRRVVLCEQAQPGAGATGSSGAFIQLHFCQNEAEARLTLAALPYFQRWHELVGAGTCGFVPAGYLRLEPPARVATLQERVAMLRSLGVDTRVIAPDEVARLAPDLRLDGVAAAAFEPGSGYADAGATVAGLIESARRNGAEIWTETAVTAIRTSGGAVQGVETARGPIDAPAVVLAVGAWSTSLLRPVGLDLPLRGALTQAFHFSRAGETPAPVLTVGDGVSQSYVRADGKERILIGLGESARRPLADPSAPPAAVPDTVVAAAHERLAARLVGGSQARYLGAISGPITLTPDDLPIIDRHPSLSGLCFFAGDCGSSFKTAPAIGRVLAEWIVFGQPHSVDVSAFRLARFDGTGAAGG